MKLALLLVGITGCNQILGLEDVTQGARDRDGDGFVDELDNCPDVANPDQSDVDSDGRGDVCDNCPLLANFTQADDGDGDGVGDVCDPHPVVAGDCLVLFDGFGDPAAFDAHWNVVVSPGDFEQVDAVPHHATLTPHPPMFGPVAMIARADDGTTLHGSVDVQVHATELFVTPGARLHVVTDFVDFVSSGYQCGIVEPTAVSIIGQIVASPSSKSIDLVPRTQFGPGTTIRLDASDVPLRMSCGITLGISVAAGALAPVPVPDPSGGSGILVGIEATQIDGVALYGVFATCPAPIIR